MRYTFASNPADKQISRLVVYIRMVLTACVTQSYRLTCRLRPTTSKGTTPIVYHCPIELPIESYCLLIAIRLAIKRRLRFEHQLLLSTEDIDIHSLPIYDPLIYRIRGSGSRTSPPRPHYRPSFVKQDCIPRNPADTTSPLIGRYARLV